MNAPNATKIILLALLSVTTISYAQKLNPSANPTDTSCHWVDKTYSGTFPEGINQRASGWVQYYAFSDEFNSAPLDVNKWYIYDDFCHSMSPQAFFSGNPDNVNIVDSALHLNAKHLSVPESCTYMVGTVPVTKDYTYSAGYIRSNAKIRYGYIEVLCNLPSNIGLNPCFWMHGNSDTIRDEIDVFEKNLENNSNCVLLQNVYGGGGTNDRQRDLSISYNFSNPFVGTNRVFAVEWLPEEIHFYINGEVSASVKYTNNNSEVDKKNFFTCTDFRNAMPMQIMLSLSVNDSIIHDPIPTQGFDIMYIKSFKLVDGGNTNHWPNYFSMTDPYLYKVNKTLRLGGEGKSAVIPPQINYTAWAKDSIMLLKGFVADSTFFSARVIHGESELYLDQANEE